MIPEMPQFAFGQRGFTLIEIIVVFILISILAAYVATHSITSDAGLYGEAEILKGHLRYAQMKAMNANNPWGLRFSGNSYTLLENGVASTTPLPGESSDTHSAASGVSIASSTSPITFDRWGSPGASTVTITLTANSKSVTVTVTRNTGFIP